MKPALSNNLNPDPAAPGKTEFQVQQNRTFQSLNQLASGIAHDFNNIIAGIIGSAEMIKLDAAPGAPASPFLDQIFTVSGRARHLVLELKNFSQRTPGQRTLIQLPPVIDDALKLIRPQIPAAVKISCRADPKCPAILADAEQIQQAVISLCTNTAHSLAGQTGQIEVHLENCEVDPQLVAAHPGLSSGPHVRLSIRDRATHFSKSMLDRMFEPFACKQANGHNSGLELFTVREIVHAHEGEITVASAPGEGTVFQLYFPVPADAMVEKMS